MHTKNSSLTVAMMSLVLASACGSSADDEAKGAAGAAGTAGASGSAGSGGTGGAAGSGGGADSGGAGGTGGAGGDAAAATINVSGTLDKFTVGSPDAGAPPVLAGVEVCVWKRPEIPCVKSDNLGQYVLPGVPANAEIGVTYEKVGYLPTITPLTTTTNDITQGWTLAADADAQAFASVAGFTISATTGMVWFRANGGDMNAPVTGATATITPSSGVGPVYVDATNAPDKTLTSTTSVQWGIFGGVTPGDVEVAISHPTLTCKKEVFGWKSASGIGRVPVTGGYLVEITARCE